MLTECSASEIGFGRAGGRRVVADFEGGMVSSDAGALLLGETDTAIRLVDRFAAPASAIAAIPPTLCTT